MDKEVIVRVLGRQYDGTDSDEMEVVTTGTYYYKKGNHYIIYEEMLEEFDIPTRNILKVKDDGSCVKIIKRGVVNAQIELVEWNTWLTEVYMGGEFESTVIAFDGTLAPSDWLERFCSDSAENFMHYSNEEFDALYEKAYSAVDQEEKSQYYKEAEMILAEDAANVYIQEPADFVGIRDELAGYCF